MLSRAYHAGDAKLGAIFGTGTNAAYLEKTSKIKTLVVEGPNLAENMIVNTEWGGAKSLSASLSESHLCM